MEVQVLGVSGHKGEFEGRSYSFCRLYICLPLDETSGQKRGYSSGEMRGEYRLFSELKDEAFPCKLDLSISRIATGGGKTKEQVTGWRKVAGVGPVSVAK